MSYTAFFDLDKTILDCSSGSLYIRHLYRKKIITVFDLAKGFYAGLTYRLGMSDNERIVRKWAAKYNGHSETELSVFTEHWFNEEVVHHFRKSVLDEIEYHKSRNARTVILSAATRYICEPVKNYLAMDKVLCTDMEVKDGHFTGNIEHYCFGKNKVMDAVADCEKHNVHLKDIFFYGDSYADSFLLKKAGHPVCVAPDWKLRKMAAKNGWRTIPH